MDIQGWKYYNHAAVPTTSPHESPDIIPVENGSIWKIEGGTPLLARWTEDFDCGCETNWWYVIKDTPFDISELKAKRRYEINKGIKNFDVVKIDPLKYKEELYAVQVDAFSAYPEKYRPNVDKSLFTESINEWDSLIIFGAFHRDLGEMCGYAMITPKGDGHMNFSVLKTKPAYEKDAVNAALVNGVLEYLNGFLENGGYLCDGTRSINHETAFQDYLEKYFSFRKAYCKLCIAYNPKIKWLMKLLFPFRRILLKLDGIGIFHLLNSVLLMDELSRERGKK